MSEPNYINIYKTKILPGKKKGQRSIDLELGVQNQWTSTGLDVSSEAGQPIKTIHGEKIASGATVFNEIIACLSPMCVCVEHNDSS